MTDETVSDLSYADTLWEAADALRGQLERKVGSHDEAIKQLVAAMRQLMAPPDPPKREMGFHTIRDTARKPSEPSPSTASVKPPSSQQSSSRSSRKRGQAEVSRRMRKGDSSFLLPTSHFPDDAHPDLKADFVLANPPFNDSPYCISKDA